ncbi:MAG TPA: diguanylate cyclase [Candidatus Limnocylindrales bacterium]|nr:diguanylate cyclase [Candidatus Limnocylindrales bacterium]
MPNIADLAPNLLPIYLVVSIVLVAAILGATGFALTVVRRQTRRVARLLDLLASSTDARHLADARGIRDPRLRASFGQLAERLTEVWTLATIDHLTGVLNRQAVLANLENEIDRAARFGHQLSVVMVDLDHFKRLNDTHGHAGGDRILRRIADTLRENMRSIDVVGRYGGEEFLLVLPETDVDAAASLAEKLRRLVGRTEVVLEDGYRASATLSAGVAGGFGGHLNLETLVRDADNAMYSAKALGRDQVYVFHELEDNGLVRRAAIAPDARNQAIEVGRAAFGAATDSLTAALDSRAGFSGKPSTMIAGAAVELAHGLGLPESEIERIRVASMLHDLGKLAIPEEILTKPGELNDPEWRIVSEHPKIGQVILEQAGALRDAATIVLHHHEWFDGRGYPHGLAGEEIPVGARIVAIADAYEAMVAGRPYRDAISHEDALRELQRHSGMQFDPDLVQRFTELFAERMPFVIDAEHGHPHPHLADTELRSTAEIHDALHDRRRRVVQTVRAAEAASTGTEG